MFTKEDNKYLEYHEIITGEEAARFQKENYYEYCMAYKEKVRKMTRYEYRIGEMRYFMEGYLGMMYSQINEYMRTGYCGDENHSKILDALIDRINEMIICAPVVKDNMVVYRGVSLNTIKVIMEYVKEYDSYMEKAFMSTSLRCETVLREFPSYECILKIYVPKGARALGVDCLKDRGEEEMIFPENQLLKYVGKKKDSKIGKTVYEFELVNCYIVPSSD